MPSLDLYRDPDPFRVPHPREINDFVDLVELGVMSAAGFPEPLTFSLRARRILARRMGEFDIVHDNQSLGSGLLGMLDDGWPLLVTLHHPITVDRQLALSHAETPWKAPDTKALVRVPAHADQGRPAVAESGHGVRVLAQGHRDPDGSSPVADVGRVRSVSTTRSSARGPSAARSRAGSWSHRRATSR